MSNLANKLDLDLMKPIKSRLTALFRQEPLAESESRDFVHYRLEKAKAPDGHDHARCHEP